MHLRRILFAGCASSLSSLGHAAVIRAVRTEDVAPFIELFFLVPLAADDLELAAGLRGAHPSARQECDCIHRHADHEAEIRIFTRFGRVRGRHKAAPQRHTACTRTRARASVRTFPSSHTREALPVILVNLFLPRASFPISGSSILTPKCDDALVEVEAD